MDDNQTQASVLLTQLPKAAFCGINLLSFTASPRFVGIKHLPPGWHFIFVGTNDSFALRHGSWFEIKDNSRGPPEIAIYKWDPAAEELLNETNPQEVLKWRANLGNVWREGMTPYRQTVQKSMGSEDDKVEETHDWVELTDRISSELLKRITRQGDTEENHFPFNSASSAKQDMDHIPGLTDQEVYEHQQELSFLPINLKRTWREGAIGRERTDAAQDRSWALKDLVDRLTSGIRDVVGEFQLAFILVLTLNNNSALEQWRRILELMLTCRSAALKYYEEFVHFLRTLKLQLEHCDDADGGLFDISDQGGRLLRVLLKRFRQGLEGSSGEGKIDILDELDELEVYLREKHGWLINEAFVRRGMVDLEDGERVEMDMNGADEEDEEGDYAPVIVELTPEQAREFGHDEPNTAGPRIHAEDPEVAGAAQEHFQSGGNNDLRQEDYDAEEDEMDERY